ncbi:TetR family transcriptional regulator [Thalassobacillus devorans]|uniref:TetR family transcriptional regulator n=1 Tax=Thalassobacillus devorans TaxID=279813 RepID=A0ABQ1NJF3_9BACI|nr:TetR/AcrR family transcriptional regulator [Thalassobacillus devorans]NIK27556.1 AcrR family transcriptional regulator [Thalassobacillus devorans]GGC78672.1 TetR family transcriptional regulator [Thalassobacillus devorans]
MDTDKRVRRTKKALQNSLLTLMEEKDFHDITITDIVTKADYNRGTFYKHYQYKEDLLDEIIENVMTGLKESYREPSNDKKTTLSSSAIKIFDHVEQNAKFYQIVIRSNALPNFQEKFIRALKELASEDLIALQPTPDIDPDLHASYQFYAIFGMIIEWVNSGLKHSPSYMAEQLLTILKSEPVTTAFKTKYVPPHMA